MFRENAVTALLMKEMPRRRFGHQGSPLIDKDNGAVKSPAVRTGNSIAGFSHAAYGTARLRENSGCRVSRQYHHGVADLRRHIDILAVRGLTSKNTAWLSPLPSALGIPSPVSASSLGTPNSCVRTPVVALRENTATEALSRDTT